MKNDTHTIEHIFSNSVEYFNKQLFLLKKVNRKELSGKAFDTWILIASALSTGSATILLSKKHEYFFTETVMLSRSFLEKIINFCYLQVCSNNEFERFLLHPYYRQYHNLDRSKESHGIKVGLKFSEIKEFKKMPQVENALNKFSQFNPSKNWSKKTVDEKVSFIKNYSKLNIAYFLISTLTIYSDASESLHGSLYGCAYQTRVYEPSINHLDSNAVATNNLKSLILLYANMGILTHSVFQLLKHHKSNVDVLFNESKNNQNEILKILKKMTKY